jgi:tetratricopeptide (TPR) repeat protein
MIRSLFTTRAFLSLTILGLAGLTVGATGCGRGSDQQAAIGGAGAEGASGAAGGGADSGGAPGAGAGAIDVDDLGSHSYRITTASPEAQKAFDRGLTLAYSFSHERAEREFRRAAEIDPKCAMAWWGVALVNGPHINFPVVPPDKALAAWDALTKAQALAPGASETERALIGALAKRYANPQPEDRRPLDEAYADAMRAVYKAHPQDADVAVLFAESAMDLVPWDLWTYDGKPRPGEEEIQETLEHALALDPDHPGANHLYIHVVEASNTPEKGIPSAERLRTLVPGVSHMVHMPSHVYSRVGRWSDAAAANVNAVAVDAAMRATDPRPGLYALYVAHNQQFLAFASIMEGRSADALKAARAMVAGIPPEFYQEYGEIIDGFSVIVPEVQVRFGKWEEVLQEPEPPENLLLARALWRFTRAVSLTALGRADDAAKERAAFLEAAAAVPKDRPLGNNPASAILAIARLTLDGEMAAKQGNLGQAEKLLREAVEVEDGLKYDDPPDWMQPVRHTLGAVLLNDRKYAEAEQVYREDLVHFPENGWSLYGLGRALHLQGKHDEAAAVEARYRKIWTGADMSLGSTCFCRPGA